MEATALCFRLLMLEFTLLNSYTLKSDAASLRITPNRLQHFKLDSVTFECVGSDASTNLRVMKTKACDPDCDKTYTGSSSTIERVYPSDIGEYWCETGGGERSYSANITVTAGPVILESPVLPVMEGDSVTLSCRNKTTSTNLPADFFKDGRLIMKSSSAETTIKNISKSDEGLYRCSISGVGESAESWLAVRGEPLILESPVLPVKEGINVTLSCRKKSTLSNLPADFYKDGLLISSSSTGEFTIYSVSESDEGLYKCSISDGGESAESWLAVRALHRETCPSWDHSIYLLLLLRTVFTIVMVALLLLLVGLLHCGKLTVTQKCTHANREECDCGGGVVHQLQERGVERAQESSAG
ncbi:low affinity immunoglobulin gamma Fc region receptor II-like [Centropristis striata]|uniref:low affinity immunoglobulin gamma Fc region receptor II-like n=1 Tax=Centropristis striata TaxID=184440 RepID=UPI0027E1C0D4|nr:low affinity immunoglobulin gamma Fc region receptor II-like [Centropristis striata]